GSQAFRTFIRKELMPAIRARYRTTDETAIVGESLAGLFVVETFLKEPDLFNTYIAFDPSLWWNKEGIITAASADLKSGLAQRRTLYMGTSSDGNAGGYMTKFAAIVAADAGPLVTSKHVNYAAELHSTVYHPAALAAFRELFKPSK
ncbi:MAG TPA: alpha/beta hydrolase-fold protein, partial [Vicinamibacterales bacterium]|nr:alpha/beta hydrolase-fold protein [Vicinamibacterales bacterium]